MGAEKAEKLKHEQRLNELFKVYKNGLSTFTSTYAVGYHCEISLTHSLSLSHIIFGFLKTVVDDISDLIKADKASLFIVSDDQLWAQVGRNKLFDAKSSLTSSLTDL
jgi:hypothetical protein